MTDTTDVLDGWTRSEFSAAGMTYPTYRRGDARDCPP